MSERICVYGLWHLGCVTAACLAAAGTQVIGLDLDAQRVDRLNAGTLPVAEPGLEELIRAQLSSGHLRFTGDADQALHAATVLWVAFDTPVREGDQADPEWVATQLEAVCAKVAPGTLVVVSSQVPVGFTRRLERAWRATDQSLSFVCIPENLRLGQAIRVFQQPERIVVGVGHNVDMERVRSLLAPFCELLVCMSLESAEMSKHALNGFLGVSVAYANELARVCERVGADAREVEQALRSDSRVGQRAYVSAGPPIAGGTLIRDLRFLQAIAAQSRLATPVIEGVLESNRLHQAWTRERLEELLTGIGAPRVALLGLTYKPGTDTLRRSSSVELGQWLQARGVEVRAFDPAIHAPVPELGGIVLAPEPAAALEGADAAVLATAWPEFRTLTADALVGSMRRPCVLDEAGFLSQLADDARLTYVRVGRPAQVATR